MAGDLTVQISLTGTVLLLLFCIVAFVANAALLIVLYKDPFKCFRKPMVVYIAALALLDLLSGTVAGPGIMYNYVLCIMGNDNSPVLDGTIFAVIAAEFTICTANLITLLLSTERLFVVVCPILYRRKTSVRRSAICVSCVVFYTFAVSIASLASLRCKDTPLHVHMTTTIPMVALITVNIVLVIAVKRHNKKLRFLLEHSESSLNSNSQESKRREREKYLAVTRPRS